MKNLIDIKDLSTNEIEELIKVAKSIMKHPEEYSEKCKNKKLATLFFEPSTRTRLSFEAAMLDLGGNVIGFSDADSSSTKKGESVSDTIRVVGGYCDIIAMRHSKEGAPLVASMKSIVPIINAGDGGHCHPTQTLTDLSFLESIQAFTTASSQFSDVIAVNGEINLGINLTDNDLYLFISVSLDSLNGLDSSLTERHNSEITIPNI